MMQYLRITMMQKPKFITSCLITVWFCLINASDTRYSYISNPSFEETSDGRPLGWIPDDNYCQWEKGIGRADSTALLVIGNGNESRCWVSEGFELKASALYELSVWVKTINAKGGTPIIGTYYHNLDLGPIPDGTWREVRSFFVTPAGTDPVPSSIRLGQWHVNGTVIYDDVQLKPAIPIHRKIGEIELGEGEIINGSRYIFQSPLGGRFGNFARPLSSHQCRFNTDRWIFEENSYVIYKHQIGKELQLQATIEISINWWNGGELIIEASSSGKEWTYIGRVSKVGTSSTNLPSHLFPSQTIWIRLRTASEQERSKNIKKGIFQVNSYRYEAKIINWHEPLIGRTDLFVHEHTPELILDVASFEAGAVATLNLKLSSHTRNLVLKPLIKVRRLGDEHFKLAAFHKDDQWIVEKESHPFTIKWDIPEPGLWIVCAELQHGEKSIATLEGLIKITSRNMPSPGWLLAGGTDTAILWWTYGGDKIFPEHAPPSASSSGIEIYLAKNEYETAEFIIRPFDKINNLNILIKLPTNEEGKAFPEDTLNVFKVGYVFIELPTDNLGEPGLWPDPLLPIKGPITLLSGQNHTFWIRIKAPKEIPAGTYKGSIELNADNWSATLPLLIKVYNFSLPDRMSCQTAFGFNFDTVRHYHKIKTTEQARKLLQLYLENFSQHHISPYNPVPLDPIKIRWPERTKIKTAQEFIPQIDWTSWDNAMTEALERYHFNSFMLPGYGLGGGTFHSRVEPTIEGYSENNPEYWIGLYSLWKQIQDHLEEKGWLPLAYVYWFDEPEPKDYEFVMKGFRKLKEAAPLVWRMLTEEVHPDLIGGPNLWCPLITNYDPETAKQRRKFGERFWWYICTAPKAPYVGLFIDHPGPELRVWLWQSWQYGLDGILVWETVYWTSPTAYPNSVQNPYEDPMSWVSGYGIPRGMKRAWGNGDGRFLYPPLDVFTADCDDPVMEGPVDSIRWEMLRDGIEDYEYFVLLQSYLSQLQHKLPPIQIEEFKLLLRVPPQVSSDLTHFTPHLLPLLEHRHKLARAIELLRSLE